MPHLLGQMKSTRVPRRFVFFATESVTTRANGSESQRWAGGVTSECHWQTKEQHWSKPLTVSHSSPQSLWEAITSAARNDTRTVVVAHNLGFHLRIANGFTILASMGWRIDKLVIAQNHVGFDLTQHKRRLVVIDSTTVIPGSIRKLGDLLEMPRGPGAPEGESSGEPFAQASHTVEVLSRAYLIIVDLLRSQDLGCWARTGSGIAWNTFIRRFLDTKVLVHGLDDVREIEAEANYGGRNEVWKWGRLSTGTWTEWDAELAYASVLATESLPSYYRAHVIGVKMKHIRASYPGSRWLVHAEVETNTPTLPLRDQHGSYFPIGTFTGWWWDCELLLAERLGARISVMSAHRYTGEDYLATWANWVIDRVADKSTPEARIVGVAAKHFQRSIVGRSAMRFRTWSEVGPAWLDGVSYMPMLDLASGVTGEVFQAGGRCFEAFDRTWWDSALPQLLSAVSAHCRVRLYEAMECAGFDHVAYVDTDSLIVDDEGSRRLRARIAEGGLYSFRIKSTLRRLSVWAPRYVTSRSTNKIAGVGRDRIESGEHRYIATNTERLPAALNAGHLDSVVTTKITAQLSLDDYHRDHLPGGETAPYRVIDGERITDQEATG